MDRRIYFISDVHLQLSKSDDNSAQVKKLHSFLDEVHRRRGILYIVGDLFDFWFEYRHVIARRYFQTLVRLNRIIENGGEVHYIAGNHDFWLNDFLSRDLGIKTYFHPLETEIQGKRILIIHGDGLLKKDYGYRFLKKILRNRLSIFLFRLVHPDFGYWLARKVSHGSRKLGLKENEKIEAIRLEITAWAEDKLKESFDAVIMGHYHQVIFHNFGGKHFINLGDWIRHFTFAYLYKGKLSLNYWRPEGIILPEEE